MIRFIEGIVVFILLGYFSVIRVTAQSEFFKHFAQMPWPEDPAIQKTIEDVWATYPHSNWIGPFPYLVPGYIQQWEKYRNAVIYILNNDQELASHGFLIVYYLKRLPPDAWEKDGLPLVTRFLEITKDRDDLRDARNQAFEALFFRATEHQIAQYLRIPADMKLIQEYLTSIWTEAALQELSVFLNEIKNEPGKPNEKLAIIDELDRSIATIKERLANATLARDEITQDYFEREGKRQYEEVTHLVHRCPRWDHESPPDYHDGADHVVRYWEKYRLGAYYLLENVVHGEENFIYIGCAICPVHTQETTVLLGKLLEKSEQNPDSNVHSRATIIKCYMHRIGVEELNRRFQKYLFEYGNHLSPDLPDKFGAIGNEESLSILRKAKDFWQEKNFQPYVELFQRNIQSIEQRLGIAPVVNPVHSSN